MCAVVLTGACICDALGRTAAASSGFSNCVKMGYMLLCLEYEIPLV